MTAWTKTAPTEPGWYQVRSQPAFYTIAFLHSDGKISWCGDQRSHKPDKEERELLADCEFAGIPSPAAIEAAREALRWYEECAASMQRYLAAQKPEAVEAICVELSLDEGKRARAALALLEEKP